MNIKLSVIILLLFAVKLSTAQTVGDFRTKQNGNWNQTATWERYNGTSWVNAPHTPTYEDGVITIQSAHTVTVTADVQIDQTIVHGAIVINAGRELRVRDGNGTDLQVYGIITNYGTLRRHTSGSPTLEYFSSAKYTHAVNGDRVERATWNPNSTCEITGVTSSKPDRLDQDFWHVIWNCTGQTSNIRLLDDLLNVQGDFSILSTSNSHLRLSSSSHRTMDIGGNFQLSSGWFILSDGSANNIMNVNGNFAISGGIYSMSTGAGTTTLNVKENFTMSGGSFSQNYQYDRATINFNGTSPQTYTRTAGSFNNGIHFNIKSGADVNLGSSVISSSGNFVLESGATLRTTHIQGITSSENTGSIQVQGTRTYHNNANYHFYRNAGQSTGNGIPLTLNGILTIGNTTNTTNLTLTNGNININNKLILVSNDVANSSVASGTVAYGTNGILEYQGASAQTTANAVFPTTNGPRTLTINNQHGVTLHASRTIPTALNLTLGQFSISNNTLTLNGSINKGAQGSWAGGDQSNLIMAGTGSSTNLPPIELNNLTINRASGIGLGGNITVNGTTAMTSGTLTANGFQIIYNSNAILLYNGSATQTTGSAEFPTGNQPAQITFQNPTQVNLHENRTFNGTIRLTGGAFNIGNFTLTLGGYFQQTGGIIQSGASGQLVYSANSDPTILPSGSDIATVIINRSGGVNMAGNSTITAGLQLTDGELVIGANQLTLNGTITEGSGTLSGGTSSSIYFGGSGAATSLPAITLANLTINRANGIHLSGDVIIKSQLNLINGQLNIGSNTLFLDGWISGSGSLGGENSTLQINENPFLFLPVDLPTAELKNLYIDRMNGVNMTGDVTVHNLIDLLSGNFSIGQFNTLTINGTLNETSGQLIAVKESNLSIGGDGDAFDLDIPELNIFTLTRPNGITLIQPLTIWGNFILGNSNIDLNGNSISYQANAMLTYQGTATQTTSASEWPLTNGPFSITVNNPGGVLLHNDRTINGHLNINFGSFQIQSNTLTLNGTMSTGMFGELQGGTGSNLEIGGTIPMPLHLSGVELNNITINRQSGVWLEGMIDTHGTITLTDGSLMVGNQWLRLRNPISGDPDNLVTNMNSTIEISGTAPGLDIGPDETIRISEVSNLLIGNTNENGVRLRGNLILHSILYAYDNTLFTIETGAHLQVQDIHLENNGYTYVDPGAQLTLLGAIGGENHQYGLILKSYQASKDEPLADASLLHHMPHVYATIERKISGADWAWHQISSPITAQLINREPPGDFDNGSFYGWYEPAQTWVSFSNDVVWPYWSDVNEGSEHMIPFKGYMSAYAGNPVKQFHGEMNYFSQFFHVSYQAHPDDEYRGFNLCGNPYPSAIDWKHETGWERSALADDGEGGYTMWIWNQEAGNYGSFVSTAEEGTNGVTRYIAPMQGFWVQAAHEGILMVRPETRVHAPQPWLKTKDINKASLKLKVSGSANRYSDEAIVEFGHKGSVGGATKMFSLYADAPSIYTTKNNMKYSISLLSEISEHPVIPLAFEAGSDGIYTMDLIHYTGTENLYLEDKLTGYIHDLRSSPSYSFAASGSDDPDRFLLHFKAIGINHTAVFKPVARYHNEGLFIQTNFAGTAQLSLFDTQGRLIRHWFINDSNPVYRPLSIKPGIYYLTIKYADLVSVERLIVL